MESKCHKGIELSPIYNELIFPKWLCSACKERALQEEGEVLYLKCPACKKLYNVDGSAYASEGAQPVEETPQPQPQPQSEPEPQPQPQPQPQPADGEGDPQ